MKKILVRIAAVFGIVILVFWLSLVFVTLFMGSKIKSLAVAELNKQLATEVKVNGPITFSLFSNFPSAAITFNDVVIKETLPEKNDFLSCEKISLLFNIRNLFRKNYVIEKVTAQNGTINVRIDSLGNNNYDIFRKSNNASSDFSVKISQAALQNFLVNYLNEKNQQHYSFQTGDAKLKGDFSASKFSLDIDADAFANFLKSGNMDFLPQRNLKVKGTIDCDLDKQLYSFRNAAVTVNENDFSVNGTVTVLAEGNLLHLKITSDQLRLEQFISLLPKEYSNKLSDFTSTGDFNFSCDIDGVQSASSNPKVTASYQLDDATVSNHHVKQALQHVTLEGNFSNGDKHGFSSSEISITKFKASVEGNPLSGTLLLRDFNHPSLDVMLDGSIQLAQVYPLFEDSSIKSIEGVVVLHQCFYSGDIAQLTSSNIGKLNAGGKFELRNVKITTSQATYDKVTGAFEIKNNDIAFSNCSFISGESDLRFEGTVSNLFPFLLSSMNDAASKQKVGLNVELTSHQLKWENLVGHSSPSLSSSDNYSIPEIFYRLAGSVSGTIDQFSYERFSASDCHGKFLFLPDKIYFNDLGLKAEKGSITANGSLDISNMKHSKLQMTSQLDHLDITQLFSEFNNFSQTTLTDKNLKGVITASVSLQSTWDDNVLNKDKLHALADVSVENGELNNFDPMRALATFMRMNELRNIRFSKMQNQVEIKNRRVYIPSMQIYSSALNLQLSGSHGFDNMIDYKVQLNLLRLLTDKFRKHTFDEQATDQTTEGFLNLYLTMTGPASDPAIKYDKQAVKKKIATDLAQEKSNLKDVLKKEFNQQETSQQQAKDWKPQEGIQYFEFADSSDVDAESEGSQSATIQDQKKAMTDFKDIFKKQPKK
ncbi:MAG TPA: AsmA-like C-terminal region-containing protein [Chitinophagales bacterium]|nr:AsmA-like C-terminal region-containing protein [Chitinophagales bacterium]